MNTDKLYFRSEDSETCYALKYHLQEAKEEGLEEVELIEAVNPSYRIGNFMFCNLHGMGQTGECGKACRDYLPRNGRSGMCKNQGKMYEQGKQVKFKVI